MCLSQYAAFNSFRLLSSPFPFPLLPSLLLSSPSLFSPLISASLLLLIRHRQKQKAPSLLELGRRLSVPSAVFDDSISNDTLILARRCLFFLRDEIRLEKRATGRIIKMWLKREEPRLSLETTCDNFLTQQCTERDAVGGGRDEQKSACRPCRWCSAESTPKFNQKPGLSVNWNKPMKQLCQSQLQQSRKSKAKIPAFK